MAKTVKVACSKAPGGFYIQDVDKVPVGAELFQEVSTTVPKVITKPKVIAKPKVIK